MLTVTTPAETYDLTTVEAVKVALGIEGSADDAQLEALVTAASAVLAKACRRVFALETVVETFRLVEHPREELVLSRYPVAVLTSVVENDVTLDAADAEVNPDTGVLVRLYSDAPRWWPCGKVVVTYQAGFAADDMPEGLKQAVVELVQLWKSSADHDPLVRSTNIPGVMDREFQVTGRGLPPDILALVAPYRDARVF